MTSKISRCLTAVLLSTNALSINGFNSFVPQNNVGFANIKRVDAQSRTVYGHHDKSSQLAMVADAGIADSLSAAWASYNVALEQNPLLVKSVTAGAILGAADFAGQAIERATSDEEKEVDVARAARFAIFGLVLQAPWNHFYYLLLDGALPPTEDPFTTTTGVKVVIDQFIQAPIFTVLIFGFLGALEGKTLDSIKKQLDDDYTDTMLANW
eukprot:CAMPEP_0185727324 /NCGR_PEP_ID=MMETSP1171-20130828/3040_1 /TAXON_ID=374046 /ORGANISM="Helicotheca tamensis, Strain CCMP826" /LENGTH=210 /DNA_ID=CAMNT_0028395859 /DNA_START=54 /DNA_END=683 /DNA_ORIENTATION=-